MFEWRTRRQYLTAVGVASTIGIAGCSDSETVPESTEQSSTETEQQSADESDASLQVASKTGTVSDGAISEINIIVRSSGGSINLEEMVISAVGPDGSNTLTYDAEEAQAGSTFTLESLQDEDASLPVLTDRDRFRIVIDPGTLETGEAMTLTMTTEAGAETQVRVQVPNTLSGEVAVQV